MQVRSTKQRTSFTKSLDENDTEHLEMALTFYMYLNQLDDDTLFMANYSREEIVEGINSVSASFGITGFENFGRYHHGLAR